MFVATTGPEGKVTPSAPAIIAVQRCRTCLERYCACSFASMICVLLPPSHDTVASFGYDEVPRSLLREGGHDSGFRLLVTSRSMQLSWRARWLPHFHSVAPPWCKENLTWLFDRPRTVYWRLRGSRPVVIARRVGGNFSVNRSVGRLEGVTRVD